MHGELLCAADVCRSASDINIGAGGWVANLAGHGVVRGGGVHFLSSFFALTYPLTQTTSNNLLCMLLCPTKK